MKNEQNKLELGAALAQINDAIDELHNSDEDEGLKRGKLIELNIKKDSIQKAFDKAASSS